MRWGRDETEPRAGGDGAKAITLFDRAEEFNCLLPLDGDQDDRTSARAAIERGVWRAAAQPLIAAAHCRSGAWPLAALHTRAQPPGDVS